jgi:hypothetical protein
MLRACTQTGRRVYAIDPDILHCDEDLEPQEAPWNLLQIHCQACRSICCIAGLLHACSVVPNLETYINVYLLWYACMNAIRDAQHQNREHPKHDACEYFKRMPSRKLTVVLPAVCFWVSAKCSDRFIMRTDNVASLIAAVHRDRGDDGVFYYKPQDLRDTENAMLHLIDFEILRNQAKIDSMEKIIRTQFAEDFDSKETQKKIARQMCMIFEQVAEKMV